MADAAAAEAAETALDAAALAELTLAFIELMSASAVLFASPTAVAATLLKDDKSSAALLVTVKMTPVALLSTADKTLEMSAPPVATAPPMMLVMLLSALSRSERMPWPRTGTVEARRAVATMGRVEKRMVRLLWMIGFD